MEIQRCLPARVVLSLLCALGVMELYMSRSNLSIGIVAMVQTIISEEDKSSPPRAPFCTRNESHSFMENDVTSPTKNETFEITSDNNINLYPMKLTSTQRGNVLSAFFFGYGMSAAFGGFLADKYGTKIIFSCAIFIDAVGNIFIPWAAKSTYAMYLLIGIRLVMGIFQSACFPSLHSLVAKWVPKDEIPRFMSISYAAHSLGTIFTMTICGLIISSLGWEVMFYICGSISIVCLICWTILMYDDPESHPRISTEEKFFISKSVGLKKENESKYVPWVSILKSIPLWSIHFAHSGSMFGVSFLLSQLPIYMSSIIGVNLRTNGLLSSLPFLARFLGSIAFSWISHYFKKIVKWQSKTWKIILTFFGFGCSGATLVLVGYVGCDASAALTLFTIGTFFNGSMYAGYCSSHLDLAPNFAGTILGLSTSIAFFYAMTAPVIAGALTPQETLQEWIHVFWFVFGSYLITGTIYCIFIKTDVQPWNGQSVEYQQSHLPDTKEVMVDILMENVAKEEVGRSKENRQSFIVDSLTAQKIII